MSGHNIKRFNGTCGKCGLFHSYGDFVVRDNAHGIPSYYSACGKHYLGCVAFQFNTHAIKCECGKTVQVFAVGPKPIKAGEPIKSPHVCNASCLSAVSQDCNCECGGANHGRNRHGMYRKSKKVA